MDSSPSSDKLVKEMLEHLEPPMPVVDREANSKVANFYQGRSVFITGATGYIGKALIEKLIRSCDKIKRIYILVREKRGKEIQERLTDLIRSQVSYALLSSKLRSVFLYTRGTHKLMQNLLFRYRHNDSVSIGSGSCTTVQADCSRRSCAPSRAT